MSSCSEKTTEFNPLIKPVTPSVSEDIAPRIIPINTDQPITQDNIPDDTMNDDSSNSEVTTYTHITDIFIQNDKPKVDILWVIDNSGSMGNKQASLAKHFDKFITRFLTKKIPFRMAITTTDAERSRSGRDGRDGSAICDWHKLTSKYADTNPRDFNYKFKKCINVGVKGSGTEQGLNATTRFMKRYSSTSGYAPFVREDAYFVAIIISDEEDQNTRAVDNYITELARAKNNKKGKIKVFSIINTKRSDLLTSYESIGNRYKRASIITRSRYASIKSNFSNTLANFSDSILYLIESFSLNKIPAVKDGNYKIIVKVNNLQTTKFTYDNETNSIIFWKGYIPKAGNKIQISYQTKSN